MHRVKLKVSSMTAIVAIMTVHFPAKPYSSVAVSLRVCPLCTEWSSWMFRTEHHIFLPYFCPYVQQNTHAHSVLRDPSALCCITAKMNHSRFDFDFRFSFKILSVWLNNCFKLSCLLSAITFKYKQLVWCAEPLL